MGNYTKDAPTAAAWHWVAFRDAAPIPGWFVPRLNLGGRARKGCAVIWVTSRGGARAITSDWSNLCNPNGRNAVRSVDAIVAPPLDESGAPQ